MVHVPFSHLCFVCANGSQCVVILISFYPLGYCIIWCWIFFNTISCFMAHDLQNILYTLTIRMLSIFHNGQRWYAFEIVKCLTGSTNWDEQHSREKSDFKAHILKVTHTLNSSSNSHESLSSHAYAMFSFGLEIYFPLVSIWNYFIVHILNENNLQNIAVI